MSEQEELDTDEVVEESKSAFDLPSGEPDLIETIEIPTSDIAELENIRGSYHGIEGLAETMHLEGQLQACWVRESDSDAEHGKKYELIFGYRRKKAAEFLWEKGIPGWDKLRCEVRRVEDGKELTKIIVENWQRESPSPVSEARAMMALKESQSPPMSNVEIARRLGCDPSQVSHRLSLLSLALPKVSPAEEEEEEVSSTHESESGDAPEEEPRKDIVNIDSDEDINDEVKAVMEETPKPPKKKEKEPVDILEMVHKGELTASAAEVIASMDNREEQEQAARLAKKHDWSVKKINTWAKKAKEHRLDEGDDSQMGPIEMVTVDDVVDLPHLNVRDDLTELEYRQINLFVLLRNSMDKEITDYLKIEMNIPYESFWEYIRGLKEEQVLELTNRMLVRYISAAHRYSDLDPELKDQLGAPEDFSNDMSKLKLPPVEEPEPIENDAFEKDDDWEAVQDDFDDEEFSIGDFGDDI